MWSVVLQARLEHSADRTELARTYRQLFAERAVENHVYTKAMTARMRERDRVIRELETTVVGTERRAIVAETTVKRVQRRLAEADGRIITLEEYLARSQAEHRAAVARLEAAEAEGSAVESEPFGPSPSLQVRWPRHRPGRRPRRRPRRRPVRPSVVPSSPSGPTWRPTRRPR